MKYRVINAAGLLSSDFLHVFVEQYSVNTFSYSFNPPNATNLTLATQLATDLLTNSSLATSLAAIHLPAFGVAPESIRSVGVNSTSVHAAGPSVNMTTNYTISIEITVVLVREKYEERSGM